ncbi:MAG: methylenetetrahydrofolate reductase [Pseudomonadota bacterium]
MSFVEGGLPQPEVTAARLLGSAGLLADVSVEATPKQILDTDDAWRWLPPGSDVYVTTLGKDDLERRLAAARALSDRGLRPVPHLPARALASRAALDETLAAYRAFGIDGLLLVAGDVPAPAGPFHDTLGVLQTGLLERHGIRRLGIAGHPTGHPVASVAELDRALDAKLDHARSSGVDVWVVTQFVFEAAALKGWVARQSARLAERDTAVPVRAGLAGPASTATLVNYAIQCGVGASARGLARRPDALRLFGRWSPDAIVADLEAHRFAEPTTSITGLHLFPFGGLAATLRWLAEARQRATGALADRATNEGPKAQGGVR